MPFVTTLHTVLRDPDRDQRAVMEEIAALSDRLIVMSQQSSDILQETFYVPRDKIDLIPHGIPDLRSPTRRSTRTDLALKEKTFC